MKEHEQEKEALNKVIKEHEKTIEKLEVENKKLTLSLVEKDEFIKKVHEQL